MKNIIIAILTIAVTSLGFIAFNNSNGSDDQTVANSDSQQSAQESTEALTASKDAKSLADSGLEKVPTSLFNDTSITELDLSGNNLTGALPSEIQKLSKLEILDASDNNLTGIPAEIGQLSRLRIVSFANNDISGLPQEIGNMSKLEILDLRGNPNVSTHDLGIIQPKIPNAQVLID